MYPSIASTICQKTFEYVSSTLATSTEVCTNPLSAFWLYASVFAITILFTYIVFKTTK